jgi:Zn-finger in ubiquitin-hydrolases and other protein
MLSNVKFAVQRLLGSDRRCGYIDQIRDVERGSEGCEQCVALGDSWVHLRMCMTCGQVGFCDSSKNKHAHLHADGVGHPIARSAEPGEDWMWCYVDEKLVTNGR